jgi:predicted ribonuclease YlaK
VEDGRRIFVVVDTNILLLDQVKILENLPLDVRVIIPTAVFEQVESRYLRIKALESRGIINKDDKIREQILWVYPILFKRTKLPENNAGKWIIAGSKGTGLVKKLMKQPICQKVARTDKGDVRILATVCKLRDVYPGDRIILFTRDKNLQLVAWRQHVPVICALKQENGVLKATKVFAWYKEKSRGWVSKHETLPLEKI